MEEDRAYGIFADDDESVVLTGHTNGLWSIASSGATDWAAVKLDENGNELWRWQVTQLSRMCLYARTHLLSKTFVLNNDSLCCYSIYMENILLCYIWFVISVAGSLSLQQNGSSGIDFGRVSTSSGANSEIIVAGSTSGAWALDNSGGFDFSAVRLNIGPPTRASPTMLQEQAGDRGGINATTMLAVLFCGLSLILIAGVGWYCRKRVRKIAEETSGIENDVWIIPEPLGTVPNVDEIKGDGSTNASLQLNDACEAGSEIGDKCSHDGHRPSVAASATGGAMHASSDDEEAVNATPASQGGGNSPIDSRRRPVRGIGIAQAVLGAAQELAQMSQFPGVSELAGLVVVLMNMVNDNSTIAGVAETMVKRCRSVMFLLQSAASVLQEVRADMSRSPCKLRMPRKVAKVFFPCLAISRSNHDVSSVSLAAWYMGNDEHMLKKARGFVHITLSMKVHDPSLTREVFGQLRIYQNIYII